MSDKKFIKINSQIEELTKVALENGYFFKQANSEEMAKEISKFIKTLDEELIANSNSSNQQVRY